MQTCHSGNFVDGNLSFVGTCPGENYDDGTYPYGTCPGLNFDGWNLSR